MILISGTKLGVENLPFSDVIEYQVEYDIQLLVIKLKTVAKSSSCFGVYLSTDLLSSLSLSQEVLEKTKTFSDDDELLFMLGNEKQQENNSTTTDNVESVFEDITFDDPVQKYSTSVNFDVGDNIQEVDLSLQEDFLTIPNSVDDIDSLKQQLELVKMTNNQLRSQLQDKDSSIDDLYRIQEIQLLEMKEGFEKRANEANKTIQDLLDRVGKYEKQENSGILMSYSKFTKNPKAVINEGFTNSEISTVKKSKSKIFIFASTSGDSLHGMMKNIQSLINDKNNLLIVDFSNDYYIIGNHKIQSRDTSLLLNDPSISVESLVRPLSKVKYIPTGFFNDIALLGVDWFSVINRLISYADGANIVLLFNNINSFSVRYTVSKLSTLGSLLIFAKSSPLVLATMSCDIAFIPSDRFRVVVMEYIDVVKDLLEKISSKYAVSAFKGYVNWSKLGVV